MVHFMHFRKKKAPPKIKMLLFQINNNYKTKCTGGKQVKTESLEREGNSEFKGPEPMQTIQVSLGSRSSPASARQAVLHTDSHTP